MLLSRILKKYQDVLKKIPSYFFKNKRSFNLKIQEKHFKTKEEVNKLAVDNSLSDYLYQQLRLNF